MQCSKCPRDAMVFQPYSGLHLCDQHIIADVEAKAKKVIRAQGWLKSGDHIAVPLSIDKSSGALLYFLKKLTAERRDIRISAIMIDDGTSDPADTLHLKRIAERLDTECITGSWEGKSGEGVDPVTQRTGELSASCDGNSHHFLLLEKVAQQHGITKIARGFSVDEAAGAVLESVIRGEAERLSGKPCPETIPRICPFISVTAAEISLYAVLCGFGDEPALSPEQGDELHKDTVTMLESFTNNHPATKYALLNLGENLAVSLPGIAGLIHACEWFAEYQQRCCNNGSIQSEVKDGTA